ncbi:MAG TPA: hypothetical protein VIH86_01825, partial [Puia sp.]
MNSFLKNILQKNIYLLIAIVILFIAAWGINIYSGSNASVKYFDNAIQNFLQKSERDCNSFLEDTSLIYKLASQKYSQKDLDKLIEKKYAVFIYEKENKYKLKFWNNQRASLPPDSLLQKKQTNYFCVLDNGQYEVIKANLSRDRNNDILVIAL